MVVLTHLLFELSTYLSRNRSLAAVQTLRTSLLARRTSLRSWLLRLSFSSRSHAVRLTANALLSSASVWASPLHPRPSVVRFGCGTSAAAACRVAVANAIFRASTLISLEGRARRRASTTVVTSSRSCGSAVNLRRLRMALYPLLPGVYEQIGQTVSHGPLRRCGPR